MSASSKLRPAYQQAFIERARPDVRHCGQCRQNVYLVTTLDELRMRAEDRQCVAVIHEQELPWSARDVSTLDGGAPPRMMTMGVLRAPDE